MALREEEANILDAKDQKTLICGCGATLDDYRRGQVCNADLGFMCAGFKWVERALGNDIK